MRTPKKAHNDKLKIQANFEEIDHRLACGWFVEDKKISKKKRIANKSQQKLNK